MDRRLVLALLLVGHYHQVVTWYRFPVLSAYLYLLAMACLLALGLHFFERADPWPERILAYLALNLVGHAWLEPAAWGPQLSTLLILTLFYFLPPGRGRASLAGAATVLLATALARSSGEWWNGAYLASLPESYVSGWCGPVWQAINLVTPPLLFSSWRRSALVVSGGWQILMGWLLFDFHLALLGAVLLSALGSDEPFSWSLSWLLPALAIVALSLPYPSQLWWGTERSPQLGEPLANREVTIEWTIDGEPVRALVPSQRHSRDRTVLFDPPRPPYQLAHHFHRGDSSLWVDRRFHQQLLDRLESVSGKPVTVRLQVEVKDRGRRSFELSSTEGIR